MKHADEAFLSVKGEEIKAVQSDDVLKLRNDANEVYGSIASVAPGTMHFCVQDPKGQQQEVIRLEPNGDIYVRGRLIENDKDVVTGMRELIQGYRRRC